MGELFWILTAIGSFYLLFRGSAPASPPVSIDQEGGQKVPVAPPGPGTEPGEKVQIAGKRVGTGVEDVKSFTGGAYDPAKNPFRKQAPPPVDVPDVSPDEFPGSYDDLMPSEEIPGDPDEGIGEGLDEGEGVDTEPDESENNGQII